MRPRLPMIALAGWLFADLLLAFSIVALGTQDPPPRPRATPTPAPTPSRLALERRYVQVSLNVDPDAAARGDESAVQAIRRAVRAQGPRLAGRRAGIVLTFGAQHSGGEGFANDVNRLLPRADGLLFGDVATRDFQLLGASGGAVLLNIYLFYDH
ncbi:hypothetical protein [Thermomonospora cellulosilytica]|uniref:Uncharacterized protein n=1 Tax=Thermomonospora cellulosilytica TaxID=1411118 RepID=A0A7W3MV72_9ACTN|nr:hypothetical protein [Thermomonospora cellulosilytica]MBA9002498.1 hypothetical protein [Thermomonospora cellulosilytica]